MAVRTVKGDIAAVKLGMTLMHEHIFIDLSFYVESGNSLFPDMPDFRVSLEKLCLENLGTVRRNMFSIRDNLVLDNVDTALTEVMYFKNAGGSTIVDVTPWGAGSDLRKLKTVSEGTGVNIVAACGYYQMETYPAYTSTETVGKLADRMMKSLMEGDDDHGIRTGIIGEIGVSMESDGVEKKIHEAVAAAQHDTGVPVMIHPCGRRKVAPGILDFFEKRGVDLCKVIISHFDIDNKFDADYQREVLKRGANIGFDNFGHEHPRDFRMAYAATDWERAEALAQMVSEGYVDQIFVSSDLCFKMQLKTYGGWGYAHLFKNMLPYFNKAGIGKDDIERIFIKNPARILDF